MCRCHAEHQVAFVHATMEKEAAEECRNGFSHRSEDADARHHEDGVSSFEQQSRIDKHADTDKEVRDEYGIADKLDAVHQR